MDYHPVIQAAGHDGALQNSEGTLFIKPAVKQEADFYEKLSNCEVYREKVEEDYEPLQNFTCSFLGLLTEQVNGTSIDSQTEEIRNLVTEAVETQNAEKIQHVMRVSSSSSNDLFIVLDNATYGFTQPNIIDIKLGKVLWDESATDEKRARLEEVSNTTTSGQLGYRIAGMNLYDPTKDDRQWYDKFFGRNLNEHNVVTDGLAKYFLLDKKTGDSIELEKKLAIIEGILDRLQSLKLSLEHTEVRMISSSILIVYEGDKNAFDEKLEKNNAANVEEVNSENDDDSEDDPGPILFRLKLIDFAHSKFTPGQGPDENVLYGIRNLIKGLKQLAKDLDKSLS